MTAALAIALTLGAYLIGSIPTGFLVGKHRGIDVRTTGSGNIGATNVARTLGKKLGVLVLLLDASKGALPILAVRLFDLAAGAPHLVTAIGLAPIVGHCFPVWLRFCGGKGVATALGVFAVVDPLVTGIGALVFAGLYGATRIASLGSLAAAVAFPLLLWLLGRPPALIELGVAAAAIVILKHHANIRRLLRGNELKV